MDRCDLDGDGFGMIKSANGDYVLYADHDEAMNNAVREISELVAENKELKDQYQALWRECQGLAKKIKKLKEGE